MKIEEKIALTRQDLDELCSEISMAGIPLPKNVKIVVELGGNAFNDIVPPEWREIVNDIEYNSPFGIKLHLTRYDNKSI